MNMNMNMSMILYIMCNKCNSQLFVFIESM